MRPSCTYCARKHLAQALILLSESQQGYPEHFWLAMGHLAEASDELIWDYPELANKVREYRKAIEPTGVSGTRMQIPIMGLIKECGAVDTPEALKPLSREEIVSLVGPGTFYEPPPKAEVVVTPLPPPAPAERVAPAKPCGGCEEQKKRRIQEEATVARWAQENTAGTIKQRIVIIATLSDFNPSYSLVSVVLDQARAAALLPSTTVHVWVHVDANMSLLPADLPSNVEVLAILPHVGARDDALHEALAQSLADLIAKWLGHTGPATVLTHDLVFQAGLLHYARAMHLIGSTLDKTAPLPVAPQFRFFHMIHSSVGQRPKAAVAQWRATVPSGHTMVAVNSADLPYLQSYYLAPPSSFISLPNPRDVRNYLDMPVTAAQIVTAHKLHLATFLQVYPLSAPRMSAKGVTKVIDVFRALLATQGDDPASVRLLIADAHANGKEGQDQKTLMRRYAQTKGLPDECLVFVSDHFQTTAAPDSMLSAGLDRASVRSLLQLANLFVFPTTSEAGSLVLMEAAMAGNLLVLNASLPCLQDYVDAQDAFWVPFGSVKEPGESVDMTGLAKLIEANLVRSMTNRGKQAIVQKHCLETYAALLQKRLGLTPHEAPAPVPEAVAASA